MPRGPKSSNQKRFIKEIKKDRVKSILLLYLLARKLLSLMRRITALPRCNSTQFLKIALAGSKAATITRLSGIIIKNVMDKIKNTATAFGAVITV